MAKLSHVDRQGKARMVDIGAKAVTRREAAASRRVTAFVPMSTMRALPSRSTWLSLAMGLSSVHEEDLDLPARFETRGVGRDDDEDAAPDHGPENAAALVAVGRDLEDGPAGDDEAAQELGPAGLDGDVFGEDRGDGDGSGPGASEHPGEGGFYEKKEGDHGARRVAGQPEDELTAAAAEEDGLPRLDPDPPEDGPDPGRPELLLDQVVVADRDAAGEDDDVGAPGPLRDARRRPGRR